VRDQELAEREESTGAKPQRTEIVRQRAHGFAVDGRRVQEPALTLVVVPHLRHLSQVFADLAHQVCEVPYALDARRVVQVSKDFLTVAHGVDVVEVAIEETSDELVLFSTSGYSRDDLVEVQVVRERAILLLANDLDGRAVE
jgi:hypothetical protein